jgi:hypothetical protein
MSVATEKEPSKPRILWTSLEDGSLEMTWADEALLAGRNYVDVMEGRHG